MPSRPWIWLCVHLADRLPESSARAVIHGDFRLGNQIYDSHTHGISAILDWELATLGDPWSDLAYCCMPWHMSHDSPALPGLLGLDIEGLGIPSEAEFLARYCERGGLSVPVQWPIYLAFNFFPASGKFVTASRAGLWLAMRVGRMLLRMASVCRCWRRSG